MKRTLRRIASWLCVLTLCLSLLPSTAWAATSMSPRNVLFEYNWFTESWDVVSFQSPEGIAFNEIVNKIELSGHSSGASYTVTDAPTLDGESIYNEETDRYEIEYNGYTWYWYGCRILQLSEEGITPYQRAINKTFDGSAATSSRATLQFMWVPVGRDGTGSQPESRMVTYQFISPEANLPEGTEFYGSTRYSDYDEYDLKKNPDVIEETSSSNEKLENGSIDLEQIPGYYFSPGGTSSLLFDRTGFYNCYAIHEDKESGIKKFWILDGWRYDETEYLGTDNSILEMPDENITLTPIWGELATIDRNAAKKTDVVLHAIPDTEYDLFEKASEKIYFPGYPSAEKGMYGTYTLKGQEKQAQFTIPTPASSDMSQEEINSTVTPYITATDENNNVLAKWECIGVSYSGGSGTVSCGTTITLPGDPTNLNETSVNIYYSWKLVGNTVSYDLGELPEGAVVYRNTTEGINREIVTVNFYDDGSQITQADLTEAAVTKPVGASFTVCPDIGGRDLLDLIARVPEEDESYTYYEFLGWKLGDDATNKIYALTDSVTMGNQDMKFTAQWRLVSDEEMNVQFAEGEAPQVKLSLADAKIEQHASGSTHWTTNGATNPLILESDGTVYYRSTLTMNFFTSFALGGQNIQDPDFAHFNIHVQPDQNLKLFSEPSSTVTFQFTCTFLKPTGEIIVNDNEEIHVDVVEDDDTYTFTVPSSKLKNTNGNMLPFTIKVQWKPGTYSSDKLSEEICLEVLTGQIPDGYKGVVATTGVITGEIDPSKCDRMERNLDSLAASYVSGNDDWYNAFGQGKTILDALKASTYLRKTAFSNIEIPANTVYAKLPSAPSSLILSKDVAGTTDSEVLAQEFEFKVEFSDAGTYNYRLGTTTGTISSGDIVKLRDGESICLRLVTLCQHNTMPQFFIAAHHKRDSAQCRVIQHLNTGVAVVQIHMQDRPVHSSPLLNRTFVLL